ncbi:MAG TPA: addiction module protein [Marmoricola sp.]|nr:addiction module protein [Marmoricola sp.]
MTARLDELAQAALALQPDERAALVSELLSSLEPTDADPTEVDAAWAEEVTRRADDLRSGAAAGETWEGVRARIEDRITKTK